MTIRATNQRLQVRPVTSIIGAEIGGVDLREPLDAETVSEIAAALVKWKVLFFRDQAISYDQQIEFARNFGDITPAHPIEPGLAEKPEIYVVDSREEKALFGHGEARPKFAPPRLTATGWHTDITFVVNPALASILRGAVIPPYGGDTLWTNLVAAYEDLSSPIRDLIDHLQAVHRWHGFTGQTREGYDPDQPPPVAVHPVVRVHPVTGSVPCSSIRRSRATSSASPIGRTARSSTYCSIRLLAPSSRCDSAGRPTASRSGTTERPRISDRSTSRPATSIAGSSESRSPVTSPSGPTASSR